MIFIHIKGKQKNHLPVEIKDERDATARTEKTDEALSHVNIHYKPTERSNAPGIILI